MGGDSEYEPREAHRDRSIKLADEPPPDEPDWEDDEPVEFEPDPALLKRLRQNLH